MALFGQVGHVDRKLDAMTQMLKVVIQRQEEMFDFQRANTLETPRQAVTASPEPPQYHQSLTVAAAAAGQEAGGRLSPQRSRSPVSFQLGGPDQHQSKYQQPRAAAAKVTSFSDQQQHHAEADASADPDDKGTS